MRYVPHQIVLNPVERKQQNMNAKERTSPKNVWLSMLMNAMETTPKQKKCGYGQTMNTIFSRKENKNKE